MRVMFVDDEVSVLRGIQRMLECADVDWEVATATSGAEALEKLAERPADVLVADMQMPGMDGADLLTAVAHQYPGVVRIVLSGQATKQAVYRAVAPMHQYLAKPCEADVLIDTISRACSLKDMLTSTESYELFGSIASLPSLPLVYQELVDEIDSDNGSLYRVGEIVAQDPAMTAKLLQLANSAIFGLQYEVVSPAQAASVIGMEALKSLVLLLQVFKAFDGPSVPGCWIDRLVAHCTQVAWIAREIGKCEGLNPEIVDEAFTAGLLHDVGKLVLLANVPEQYKTAVENAKKESVSLIESEKHIFGLGHDGIGGYLLALWGLPQDVVEAVTFHHQPRLCDGTDLTVVEIVYLANCLAHEQDGMADIEQQYPLETMVAQLGLEERLEVWRDAVEVSEGLGT